MDELANRLFDGLLGRPVDTGSIIPGMDDKTTPLILPPRPSGQPFISQEEMLQQVREVSPKAFAPVPPKDSRSSHSNFKGAGQ